MQEFSDSNFARRATDLTPDGRKPTMHDVWIGLVEANKNILALRHHFEAQSKAFVKDDLGSPDYAGHRRAHLDMIETSKVVQGYKTDITKRIALGIVALMMSAIGAAVLFWIQEHLK